MTIGALRLSKIANGVAQLHGETSNKMWADVDKRAEILAITNAIHLPTWVDNQVLSFTYITSLPMKTFVFCLT